MALDEHPVWGVYDKLRTARLNTKYYGIKMHRYEVANFWIGFVLLAAAPTSAIAGQWFWQTEAGKIIWQYMGLIAAIISILKPILGLTNKIKEYESILSGYRILEYDLMEIKASIEQKQKYDAAMRSEFKKALQREKTLVGKNPESRESKKLKIKCQQDVMRELPPDRFYIPEEPKNG